MKLLSPSDSRTKRDTDNSLKELRSNELDSILAKKRRELAGLDDLLAARIETFRIQNEKEIREHTELLLPLRRETEELEERKKQALLPLHEKEKEIEDKAVVLLQREETIKARELDIESEVELLVERLDDVKEAEQLLDNRKATLDKRERGIVAQEKETKERSEKLTSVLQSGYLSLKEAATIVEQQKAEVSGKLTILSEKEARLVAKEQELHSREILLADRQKMLERAIEETKRKKLLPKNFKP